MEQHFKDSTENFQMENVKRENEKRNTLANKLHHLASTTAIPGVYNGVRTKSYKISNVKVDDFLRQTFKVT